MPTVKIPIFGNVEKSTLIIGGVAAGGAVLYLYMRRSQEDTSADVLYDPASGSLTSTGTYVNPAPVTTLDSTISDYTTAEEPTNSAEWVRAAIDQLGFYGYESSHVSSVLGKYIGNQQLTSDEAALVREAWAVMGRYSYLPNLRLAGEGSTEEEEETPTTTTSAPALPASVQITTMKPGQSVRSGAFILTFQAADQNLVIYRVDSNNKKHAVWSTRTARSKADRLVMQGDGNLVMYRGSHATWQSRTNKNPGAKCYFQADGNLVVYRANGRAAWSAYTGRRS